MNSGISGNAGVTYVTFKEIDIVEEARVKLRVEVLIIIGMEL